MKAPGELAQEDRENKVLTFMMVFCAIASFAIPLVLYEFNKQISEKQGHQNPKLIMIAILAHLVMVGFCVLIGIVKSKVHE